MNAYRLYTKELRNGIPGFNGKHYYILHEEQENEISLILNTKASFAPFIVARSVEYHDLDSIDWASGHYFDSLDLAIKYMKGQ